MPPWLLLLHTLLTLTCCEFLVPGGGFGKRIHNGNAENAHGFGGCRMRAAGFKYSVRGGAAVVRHFLASQSRPPPAGMRSALDVLEGEVRKNAAADYVHYEDACAVAHRELAVP
jgi:hypothetical protein